MIGASKKTVLFLILVAIWLKETVAQNNTKQFFQNNNCASNPCNFGQCFPNAQTGSYTCKFLFLIFFKLKFDEGRFAF